MLELQFNQCPKMSFSGFSCVCKCLKKQTNLRRLLLDFSKCEEDDKRALIYLNDLLQEQKHLNELILRLSENPALLGIDDSPFKDMFRVTKNLRLLEMDFS